MPDNILIISYVFPPYPGIGGRRWAKFAKHLADKNYSVHVISAKNPLTETSLFSKDTSHKNIINYELPSSYPLIHIKGVKTLLDKIWYRLSLILLKNITKGNYYDRGILWNKKLFDTAVDIIKKNNIKNVIVSGAPFSLLYFAADLKREFPEVKLIGDLRDPWTWGSGYGMQSLSDKRKKFEQKMERLVMEKYDVIFIPSVEMQSHLKLTYPQQSRKIVLLPHGYDESEIKVLPKVSSNKLRWIFYGTFYKDIEPVFKILAEVIESYKDKIKLDIYGVGNRYSEFFKERNLLADQVNYFEQVPPETLFSKFNQYDQVLILQPDFAKDFITTKIYEIIYSGTPILLISNSGKLSDFIKKHHLGMHVLPGELSEAMESILKLSDSNIPLEPFPIQEYSFASLTDLLITYFK